MITSVRLENWKAYKSFSLELESGTTFLVAPNGVGKTSFIDAVRWALDPDAKPIRANMRRGAKETAVDVTLIVEGRTIRIRRTLIAGRAKEPKQGVDVWLDGQTSDPDEAWLQLARTWKVDARFAARAAFISDRLLYQDHEPDLRAHLTRLHSLDHVQAAIGSIATAMKAANEAADKARKESTAGVADLERAKAEAASAAAAVSSIEANAVALRSEATRATNALEVARRSNQLFDGYQQWQAERSAIAAASGSLLLTIPDEADLRTILRVAEEAANRQRIESAALRAGLQERLSAIELSLHRLHEAGAECPVCRRPLTDSSREFAETLHSADLLAVQAQMDELTRSESDSATETQLRELARRAEALGDPPIDVPDDVLDLSPLLEAETVATEAVEDALELLGHAKERLSAANAKVQEIEEDLAAQSSVELYARVALLEAAKLALESTIERVLDAQVGPVGEEVNRRWEAIFPDRPGLRVGPTGQMARVFDDEGEDLEFDSFSSGEKVVASLLLRLATLTSTTEVPFLLIDEPLEHLDLDARSYVARTLAYLGSGGALNQIFVTTYEQDLALQLADVARGQVRLEFLRTAHVTS